jgi:hypothetical protein
MEPQLQTLVSGPEGLQVLIGHKLQQHLHGHPKPFWCWPSGLDNIGIKAYLVQDEHYRDAPFPVPPEQLAIGFGERDPTDPLILLLKQKGLILLLF